MTKAQKAKAMAAKKEGADKKDGGKRRMEEDKEAMREKREQMGEKGEKPEMSDEMKKKFEGMSEDERKAAMDMMKKQKQTPKCPEDMDQGMAWEPLADLLDKLTCDNGENEEGGMEEKEGRKENPCINLDAAGCAKAEMCDVQRGVCVWNAPEDGRRNLYVIYDWQYLVVDGEITKEQWCYSDDTRFNTSDEYAQFCLLIDDDEECVMKGCALDKKDGSCKAMNGKLKCSKLGDQEDKLSENNEALCKRYSGLGCKWNKKKGCQGKAKINQKN